MPAIISQDHSFNRKPRARAFFARRVCRRARLRLAVKRVSWSQGEILPW